MDVKGAGSYGKGSKDVRSVRVCRFRVELAEEESLRKRVGECEEEGSGKK